MGSLLDNYTRAHFESDVEDEAHNDWSTKLITRCRLRDCGLASLERGDYGTVDDDGGGEIGEGQGLLEDTGDSINIPEEAGGIGDLIDLDR